MNISFREIMKKFIMTSDDIIELIDDCIAINNFELNNIDNSIRMKVDNLVCNHVSDGPTYWLYKMQLKYRDMHYVIITQETINEATKYLKNNGWSNAHISVCGPNPKSIPSVRKDDVYYIPNMCFDISLYLNNEDKDIAKEYHTALIRNFAIRVPHENTNASLCDSI